MEKNDGIQIYKVTGDVDNENLLNHIKEVGEYYLIIQKMIKKVMNQRSFRRKYTKERSTR